MDNERDHEEEQQPRKIRVVDKRISARRSEGDEGSGPAPGPSGPPPSEPVAGAPATADDRESIEGQATVTPLRPQPSTESDQASESVPTDAGSVPPPPQAPPGPQGQRVWTPEQEEEARRMAEEMARIPSIEWVINVAVTLANAAGTKLNEGLREDGGLAIDALAAILEKVGDRLGEAEAPLRQTLAQLQMAYAQMAGKPERPPSN
jgi:hypothetical protein